MRALVFLKSITVNLAGASASYVDLLAQVGVVPRQIEPQADLRSNPTYRVGVSLSKVATGTLTYDHADATLTDLGTDAPASPSVLPGTRQYFHWCLYNGTSPATGGAADNILIKCYG